jgi:hypothetical protein
VQAVRNASLWLPSSRCTAYPLPTWQQNTSSSEAISSRHDKNIRHVLNDRMASLYRSYLLARLPTAYGLDTWSRLSQQGWLQPSFLAIARTLSTRYCSQLTPIQCLMPIRSTRGLQSQPFSRQGAFRPLFAWPRPHWIHGRRFSSGPPSTQTKNNSELPQRSGKLPRMPQDPSSKLKDQLVPHQMPAAAKRTGPVEAPRPNSQELPTSKVPTPPSAEPTRSAVRYIICINLLVLVAWMCSVSQSRASQQIRAYEQCKDEKCGHELCQQVRRSVILSRGLF